MSSFWRRRRPQWLGQKDGPARTRRQAAPALTPLEDRRLTFISGVSAVAIPNILVPPNNRFVQVLVAGSISDSRDEKPNAFFQVTDEYRRIEPRAHIDLLRVSKNTFAFEFTLTLQARRANEYPAGRRYYLLIAAGDQDGGSGKTIPILVPHDPRHPLGPPPPVHHVATRAASPPAHRS